MNLPEGNEGGLGPLNGLFHREQHLHFFAFSILMEAVIVKAMGSRCRPRKVLDVSGANHLHFLKKWQVILLYPRYCLPAEGDFQILLH